MKFKNFLTVREWRVSLVTTMIVFVLSYLVHLYYFPTAFLTIPIREDSTEYKFTNPILFLRTDKSLYEGEFESLTDKINNNISEAVNNNKADSVSVYFNDLNSAHWMGINENTQYAPSSMLKVVIMISALKSASEGNTLLSRELYYDGQEDRGQTYKPEDKLTAGYYTIRELINAMVLNSDNRATKAIFEDSIINQEFNKVYKIFRLPNVSATTSDFMTPRSYSSVFRILYNGGFMSTKQSDYILGFLTKTTFNKGLVAGVPTGTIVSHKFGEHTEAFDDETVKWRELHDCGIVYYPTKPYLICIMTKGSNFSNLETVISGISKTVYNYVNQSVINK